MCSFTCGWVKYSDGPAFGFPAGARDDGICPGYGYDDAEKTDGAGGDNVDDQSDPDGGPG